MSNKRDDAGRFRSKDGAQPSTIRSTFDLQVEAQRLYQMAQTRGDFTGAASVLRLMRDLRPEAGESARAQDQWVQWCSASEMNAMETALNSIESLERVAKARRELGGDTPQAHLVGPSDALVWRDTSETLEERMARPIPSIQGEGSATYAVTQTIGAQDPEAVDALEEDEIDVTDLIEDGVDLSWIPEDDTNAS